MARKRLSAAMKKSRSGELVVPTKKFTERYALVSVSDKTEIIPLVTALVTYGYKIISTGGTANVLTESGIPVIPIQEITGNPESFDGRMKTISFQIESALLFDREKVTHRRQAEEFGIKNIDVVVCNLYPFEKTVGKPHVTLPDAVENIDVGGPTMIRAAAKNFKHVLVVTDPSDYTSLTNELTKKQIAMDFRQKLAAKAFAHLSFYDAQIASFLSQEQFPQLVTLPGRKTMSLRYGENPHQKSAVYIEPNTNSPLGNLKHYTGRELSYVNFTDIFAGLESVRIFTEPAAVVIKHNSPAGIALGASADESLRRAVAADPVSAFGGVIVLNKPLDLTTAKTFAEFKEDEGVLIDIVAAPEITADAKEFIKSVRKSTGIFSFGKIPKTRSDTTHVRFFDGGFLLQDWDDTKATMKRWRIVTKKKPTEVQIRQMELAWKFISRIRSNSVIIVDKTLPMTRGIGSGQTARIMAARVALELAKDHAKDGILASDSFFPFGDSVELAVKHGIKAIIQQGGSINDQASIDAADNAGIPMVFTDERKFWH